MSGWLWVAIEPKNKGIPALTIFNEINMFVAERFIAGLVKSHGKMRYQQTVIELGIPKHACS